MKPNILPEEFTVKVISIDKRTLLAGTVTQLGRNFEYQDTNMQEHLYSCTVKEDMEQVGYINANVAKQLDEIRELCNKHNASYFRIVNP